jgi:hypothetical protein
MAAVALQASVPTPPLTGRDPRFDPSAPRSAFDRLALKLIKDERDLPFARLTTAMLAVLGPIAVATFWLPEPWTHAAGVAYLLVHLGLFYDRYILMLHNTSHRALFRREWRWLRHLIPCVLGPMSGQSPLTYYAHHMGMHHPENNLANDLSSTMRFQRDSLADFLKYWARFFFGCFFELSRYHWVRGQVRLFWMGFGGELAGYALMLGLAFVNGMATLWVLVFPFLLARFLMMAGNWAQHAFVDPADPGNPYRNSIVCIDTRYNRRCFNDGYHVGHHIKANRHWTEMPEDFEHEIPRYVAEDAVVFRGIDYFQVWAYLMARRYDKLARHFVELRATPRPVEDVIGLMRYRAQAIRTV